VSTNQPNAISPDGKYQWNGTAWVPIGPLAKKKGHFFRNAGIGCGGLILLAIIISVGAASGNHSSSSGSVAVSPSQATSSATAKAAPTPAGPTLTNQQKNAVKSAQSYLSFQAFSRQGLIDQLSSSAGEGYPVQDATIAVDSLNVDWNAEAVQSAKSYLKLSPFSCQGLIDQLDSSAGEQFTVAQATYGAQQAGAC
jgi:hypothetical protein